jgi:predicted transcriptional regulator
MTTKLTTRELDLMAVVWERGSATVNEVLEQLGESLAYTTVLTVLRGLEAKGALRHEREGKAFRFYARVRPDEVGERSIDRLLKKVFRGSRELLIAQLLADESVTSTELKNIRALLDRRLKERAD